MKTHDLGEKYGEVTSSSKKEKYYPTISFFDDGVAGVSSFDDQDVGKTIHAEVDIKLVAIESSTRGKKKFTYRFEAHKLHLPDVLDSKQRYIKERKDKKNEVMTKK